MSEQQQLLDWSNAPIPAPNPNPNPCVALYGPGPKGVKCGDCNSLQRIATGQSNYVYKCALRTCTKGSATDHRYRWSACAKFEQRTGTIPVYGGRV